MTLTLIKCPRCGAYAGKTPTKDICINCFVFEVKTRMQVLEEEQENVYKV